MVEGQQVIPRRVDLGAMEHFQGVNTHRKPVWLVPVSGAPFPRFPAM
jgi:hypothetical protein